METLRELLEGTDDKFGILTDMDKLIQHNITVGKLFELWEEFLSEEEKSRLVDTEFFTRTSNPNMKRRIIEYIKDDAKKLEMLEDEELISEMSEWQISTILQTLGEQGKEQLLRNIEFVRRCKLDNYTIKKIMTSLGDQAKIRLLSDEELMKKYSAEDRFFLDEVIESIESDKLKLDIVDKYKDDGLSITSIAKTLSDSNKRAILHENKYEFNEYQIISIISSMDINFLVDFINKEKEFFAQNNIRFFKMVRDLSPEKQLGLIAKFDEINLADVEKIQILATIPEETREKVDASKFPSEYINALEVPRNERGIVTVDLTIDPEKYRALDELIGVNPINLSEAEKRNFIKLCEICPNMQVFDNLTISSSTPEEYKIGEAWIETILQSLQPEWSDIQKVAYIDNAIGKKISYAPDFETEVSNECDVRSLWKIIASGYGVCNGIAQVEQYMLNRIGIEAEMVSGKGHTFLRLNGIEVPTEHENMVKGDTILDPTWNLATQRYGGKPNNFCRSYEEIRKHDICDNGKDLEAHQNDDLETATLELDEASLRKIYASIGIADREGNFPIKELIDFSEDICAAGYMNEENLKKQLLLLQKLHPEFATCQNSTVAVLQGVLLNNNNMNFGRCVVDRVYERKDKDKKAVLYVYADFPEAGKKFYFADKDTKQFVELSQREFEERFECYESDLQKSEGIRPWETSEEQKKEDLTKSSGKVHMEESEGR